MKIFCIGRNYADHAKELNNPVPKQPLVFMKPNTALLRLNNPFFYPDFSNDIHYEGEVVIKITKNGKAVQKEFARSYYDEMAYGIDFTARDIQQKAKEKGHPWEIAKGFDYSAGLSEFIPIGETGPENIQLITKLNGEIVQDGNTKDLLFSFDDIICYLSQFFKLQKGDLIYTGTPAGVGQVKIGDVIEGSLNGVDLLRCDIK